MLDLGKRVRGLFVKLPTTEVVDLAAEADEAVIVEMPAELVVAQSAGQQQPR